MANYDFLFALTICYSFCFSVAKKSGPKGKTKWQIVRAKRTKEIVIWNRMPIFWSSVILSVANVYSLTNKRFAQTNDQKIGMRFQIDSWFSKAKKEKEKGKTLSYMPFIFPSPFSLAFENHESKNASPNHYSHRHYV